MEQWKVLFLGTQNPILTLTLTLGYSRADCSAEKQTHNRRHVLYKRISEGVVIKSFFVFKFSFFFNLTLSIPVYVSLQAWRQRTETFPSQQRTSSRPCAMCSPLCLSRSYSSTSLSSANSLHSNTSSAYTRPPTPSDSFQTYTNRTNTCF